MLDSVLAAGYRARAESERMDAQVCAVRDGLRAEAEQAGNSDLLLGSMQERDKAAGGV